MSRTPGYFLIIALALMILGTTAHAMDTQSIHAEYVDGEYRVTMKATLNAHADRVAAVLRDYAHYNKLDSRILDSHVITHPNANQVELFTRIRVCFTFFCRDVDRTELVEERPLELLATVIPDKSDAKQGSTHTVLSADGDHTHVQYTTTIVPKFWVPALFGHSIMLHTLRSATLNMFEHIEKMAQ